MFESLNANKNEIYMNKTINQQDGVMIRCVWLIELNKFTMCKQREF